MQYTGENLAVIADDLTGACDTACQFACYGFQPVVLNSFERDSSAQHPFVVVNSDSRKDDARGAHEKVLGISDAFIRKQYLPFYKKMDSTLKGNWIAELAAAIQMTRPEVVLIAPAFPVWGRTTIDGVQHLQGKPLSESRAPAFGPSGMRAGVEQGNLVESLQTCFGKRVCLFKRSALKKGPATLVKQMESASFRGFPLQVFDVLEDDDLRTIVLAGCRLERKILWTGSAGLARYLPLGWGCSMKPQPAVLRQSDEPVLVINGSFNPANAQQLHCLEAGGFAPLLWIEDEDSDNSVQTQAKIDRLRHSLADSTDAAISVRLHKPIQSVAQLQRLQDALHFAALQCLQPRQLAGIVLVGGDTAMSFYRRIGASALRIEGEVQPGIPYGRWIGGLLDGQPLVTKAGGFGQAQTLARATAFLKGR